MTIVAEQIKFHSTFLKAVSTSDQDKWNELKSQVSQSHVSLLQDTVRLMMDEIDNGSFAGFVNTVGLICKSIRKVPSQNGRNLIDYNTVTLGLLAKSHGNLSPMATKRRAFVRKVILKRFEQI